MFFPAGAKCPKAEGQQDDKQSRKCVPAPSEESEMMGHESPESQTEAKVALPQLKCGVQDRIVGRRSGERFLGLAPTGVHLREAKASHSRG